MSKNDSDIIEISDDSSDVYSNNAGCSRQGTKRMYPTTISDSSEESSASDDVMWCDDKSKISEESESEEECENWVDDGIILKLDATTKLIHGFHLMPTCSPDPEVKAKQVKKSAQLNEIFANEDHFAVIRDNFVNDNAFEDKTCEIISDPWKVLVLNNVLSEPSILDHVRQEFYELDWNTRRMDLYEFFQSEDLEKVDSNYIKIIHDFLKTELKDWVQKLTGLELTSTSATCSFYSDSDFLLVHDDQQDNRAVAFVLYLTGTEGWSVDWGGALQLFDRDGDKQPQKCVRHVFPKNNQLILFPVSEQSYHQVEEVTCKNFCRLSINGWFHTKEPLKFDMPIYKAPNVGLHNDKFEKPLDRSIDLNTWIDESYLEKDTITGIQAYIEENSEMSLEIYFRENRIKEVTNALANEDLKWVKIGPPNRRHYEYLDATNVPEILKTFLELFRTNDFFDCINQYTGLEITKMKWELQKWTPGSYSLIDSDNKNRLDVLIYLGDFNIIGGKTHYVTLEDEIQNALVSIFPEGNILNLVYGDTAAYTSLVSRYSKSKCFYKFIASYYEDENLC